MLEGIPVSITEQMNRDLTKDVEEEEIKTAFFSMEPNKAPGSDGMSPLFFQKFWNSINQDLVSAIQGFFHNNIILKAINHTIISLIPKVDCPSEIKQFRPISLCQVVYKALAKIRVNRLKPFLSKCISKNQSAFVPDGQIIDNVILSHELLHFLKNKRQGRAGMMAVKLNMSKAYDRVEWDFLKMIMERMGFCSKWIRWIIACISSVSYSFNINGDQKEYITPTKGIRQGDPLSPYLFLLCSEGLSNLIKKAKLGKQLTGIKISRGAPAITHLFFADDSLVFCRANGQEAGVLMSILKVYEKATGQLINMDKSSVFFSKNTTQVVREEVCQAMGSIQHIGQGQYLGLPMIITRSKGQVFGYIRNAVDKKLQSWKNKLISQAGKEVMLKAVAMAMPTYNMSCFRLSSKMCREISAKMADYWWGETERKKMMHWIGWKKMTKSKSKGGMGFKDLQGFNRALLGKQVWKLLTQPNLLVSRVLKKKYYPRQSLFTSKVPQNASWIWQSLAEVRKDVQKGIRRKIGNGKATSIWEDCWIPDSKSGKPTTQRPPGCQLKHVSDLIINNRWNAVLIFRIFSQQDAERILRIPISFIGKEDGHYWIHSQTGHYTTQSGYKNWSKEKEMESIGRRNEAGTSYEGSLKRVWKSLWKQKVCQKMKVFIWKCLHGGLLVRGEIYRRTKQGDPKCAACGEEDETVEHMLLQCNRVKEVWKLAPVQWDGIQHVSNCFMKWWTAVMEAQEERGGEDHANLTINILWQIWKARNEREFECKEKEPHRVIQKAVKGWTEFEEANKGKENRKNTQGTEFLECAEQDQRQSENQARLMIKVHTHQDRRQQMVGIGVTVTDLAGCLQASWALRERMLGDTKQDLAGAVRLALLNAINQGWTSIKVELEDSELVECIKHTRTNNQQLATLVEDIHSISNLFQKCTFSFVESGFVGSIKLSMYALKIFVDEEWVNPNLKC
ncbi:uncharacterized protein [Coffea arabica]|uniref:Reverse transcriptase domain-containing protein n=1 Tax=Coffea arabica TaxID=13443 RepID=A0ABM4U728_COFAR